MFRGKTAWFSESVVKKRVNFWASEGGTGASWREADYVFSEDATCPDTVKIYESKDFLWDKVTVFHSLFLSTCEKRESVKSVSIGHYVLPPASVQHEVRKVVGRFIWEGVQEEPVTQEDSESTICLTEDEHNEEEVSKISSEPSDSDSSLEDDNHYRNPNDIRVTGYVSMESLQKYTDDLRDFHPNHLRCSDCKARVCLTPPY